MPINHNNYDLRLRVSNNLDQVYTLTLEFVNEVRNAMFIHRGSMSEKFFYLFRIAKTKLGQALWNLTSNSSTINSNNAFNFTIPNNNFGYGSQNFRSLFNILSNNFRQNVANIINYFHDSMSNGNINNALRESVFFSGILSRNTPLLDSAIALKKLGLFLYYRQIKLAANELTFP